MPDLVKLDGVTEGVGTSNDVPVPALDTTPRSNGRSKWTATEVGRTLALNTFRECLTVPNTSWSGYECDLLVVTRSGKLIDVEIKLSKDDLKADLKKEKWQSYTGPFHDRRPCRWPVKVWKHFVAVPAELWKDDWILHCPEISGVLLVNRWGRDGWVKVHRRAKANPQPYLCTPADTISLGRLACFRMWNALVKLP